MDVCFNNEENDGTPEQTTIRSWPQTPGSKKMKGEKEKYRTVGYFQNIIGKSC